MSQSHGSPATPPLARKSGRYTCLDMLGRGTYGTCYKVLQKPNKTPFVMKVIPIAELKTYDVHAAFSEAMLLSTIKHPHVVGYLDAWVENSHLYIVMEYCNRGDLAARLQRASEPLPIAEVLQYGRDISCGMQYLHSHKIMHRDVKPSNLFLHGDRLVIGDLGLGKHMEQLSVANTQVGTPLYFSPEVCREEPYAFPSDVWAFGCVLFEMLAGTPPFVASNQAALTEKICHGPTPSLPQSCPSHLSQIVEATLQKLPHRRPSMDECCGMFNGLCQKACHSAPALMLQPSASEGKPKVTGHKQIHPQSTQLLPSSAHPQDVKGPRYTAGDTEPSTPAGKLESTAAATTTVSDDRTESSTSFLFSRSPHEASRVESGAPQPDVADCTHLATITAPSHVDQPKQDSIRGSQLPFSTSRPSNPLPQAEVTLDTSQYSPSSAVPVAALNTSVQVTQVISRSTLETPETLQAPHANSSSKSSVHSALYAPEHLTQQSNAFDAANPRILKDSVAGEAPTGGSQQPLSALMLPHGSNVALHSSGVSSCVCSSPQPPTWCSPNCAPPPQPHAQPPIAIALQEHHERVQVQHQHQRLTDEHSAAQNSLQKRMQQLQQQQQHLAPLKSVLYKAASSASDAEHTAHEHAGLGTDQPSRKVSAPLPAPSVFTGGQIVPAAADQASKVSALAPASLPSAPAAQSSAITDPTSTQAVGHCVQTNSTTVNGSVHTKSTPLVTSQATLQGHAGAKSFWWPTVRALQSPFCSGALPEASKTIANDCTGFSHSVDCAADDLSNSGVTAQYASDEKSLSATDADSNAPITSDQLHATETADMQQGSQILVTADTDQGLEKGPLRCLEASAVSYPESAEATLQPRSDVDADTKVSAEVAYLPAGFFSEKPILSGGSSKVVNANRVDGMPADSDMPHQTFEGAMKAKFVSDTCHEHLSDVLECSKVQNDGAVFPASIAAEIPAMTTGDTAVKSEAFDSTGVCAGAPAAPEFSEQNLIRMSITAHMHQDVHAAHESQDTHSVLEHPDSLVVKRSVYSTDFQLNSDVHNRKASVLSDCELIVARKLPELTVSPQPDQKVPLQQLKSAERTIVIGRAELELKACYGDVVDSGAAAVHARGVSDGLVSSKQPEGANERSCAASTSIEVHAGITADITDAINKHSESSIGAHSSARSQEKQQHKQLPQVSSPIASQRAAENCLGCIEALKCVDTLKSRVAGLETLLASTEERAAADRSTLQRMTKEHAQLQECLCNGGTLSLSPGRSILRHTPHGQQSPPDSQKDLARESPTTKPPATDLPSNTAEPSGSLAGGSAAAVHASEACMSTTVCTPRRLHTRAHVSTPADLKKLLERSLEGSRSPKKAVQTFGDALGLRSGFKAQHVPNGDLHSVNSQSNGHTQDNMHYFRQKMEQVDSFESVAAVAPQIHAAHARAQEACSALNPERSTVRPSLHMHDFNASGSTNNEAQGTLSMYASPVEANIRRHAWVDESPDLSPAACTLQHLPERMHRPHALHGSSGLHQSCGKWFGSRSSGSGSRLGNLGPLQLSAGSTSHSRMHSMHACDMEDTHVRQAATDATVSNVESVRDSVGQPAQNAQYASDLEHANLNRQSPQHTEQSHTAGNCNSHADSLPQNATANMHAPHASAPAVTQNSTSEEVPKESAEAHRDDGSVRSVNSGESHENLLDTISDMRRTLEEDCGASPSQRSPHTTTQDDDIQLQISSSSPATLNRKLGVNVESDADRLESLGTRKAPKSIKSTSQDVSGKVSQGVSPEESLEKAVVGVLTGVLSQMDELQHAVQEVSGDISPGHINMDRVSKISSIHESSQDQQLRTLIQEDLNRKQTLFNSPRKCRNANQDSSRRSEISEYSESTSLRSKLAGGVRTTEAATGVQGNLNACNDLPTVTSYGTPMAPSQHPLQPPVAAPDTQALGRCQGTAHFTPSPAHKRRHTPRRRDKNSADCLSQNFHTSQPGSPKKCHNARPSYTTPVATPVKLAPSMHKLATPAPSHHGNHHHHEVNSGNEERSVKAAASSSLLSPAAFQKVPSLWTPQPHSKKLDDVSLRPKAPRSASKIAAVWPSGASLETTTFCRNLTATPPRPARPSRTEASVPEDSHLSPPISPTADSLHKGPGGGGKQGSCSICTILGSDC